MTYSHVFVSHSSKDDPFVKDLRRALESLNIQTWVDSRELAGGAKLEPEIERAIETARSFLAVLSPSAANSPWVRKEIQKALEVEREQKGGVYRVVPLLLPGIEPSALALWFNEEPVGVRVDTTKLGGLAEALPTILAALGYRLPDDAQKIIEVAQPPIEELLLELRNLRLDTSDDKRRAQAVAQLVYEPADSTARRVESQSYTFTAPLGVLEAEELRWYLEEYFIWPAGIFRERARMVEAQLPEWGRALYLAALAPIAAQEALAAWQPSGEGVERRFSVFVERELPEGVSEDEKNAASEAAAELLALPWELLHDGRGFLFHGKYPVRVRRRLPNRYRQPVRPTRLPIRILLVSPRPEEASLDYIDHRISALPLVEAIEGLGELARLTVLTPPTFGALEEALSRADEIGEPFDVVHFDGHGVYDRQVGLGGLCFEDPNDTQKLMGRATELVHAERLAEVMRDYRVPLVFLEACQSAKTEEDPTSSVAARLLEEGVATVVAMSHSVLVETARRFVAAFYRELAQGKRVGAAMIVGQRELHHDTYRGRMLGAGELRLQDWFVPVLYQEEQDPQLISKLPPEEIRRLEGVRRRVSLGELPEPPAHQFIGRSRELLALERLLCVEPWAVIRGQGGEGKTTLASELARWLVRTGRYGRAAFVSLEQYVDARGVLDGLGRQLLPKGSGYSVTSYPDVKSALQPVERTLRDEATIIVLDNLESVCTGRDDAIHRWRISRGSRERKFLGKRRWVYIISLLRRKFCHCYLHLRSAIYGYDPHDQYKGVQLRSEESPAPQATAVKELIDLCKCLLEASSATRLVFTTRESLPIPFDNGRREIVLDTLSREDAVRLVGEVMKEEGLKLKSETLDSDPQEVTELVDTVGHHARALVLLSREVARLGVRATTQGLRRLMEELHERFPGDRENSLYASLELSLRRLPAKSRESLKVLAAFHGGAHLGVLGEMLGAVPEEVDELAGHLISVGLAEDMGDGHLRLDPALPSYLLRGMSEGEWEVLRKRWVKAMAGLTRFMYQQLTKDVGMGARLTMLELPNLLAMLLQAEEKLSPDVVVELAENVERLLSHLGQPQAQAEAEAIRRRAARRLRAWGRPGFLAAHAEVEKLRERGEVQVAYASAERLLKRSVEAGEKAYLEAAYDLAMAHYTFGRTMREAGAAAGALPVLQEAQRRFEALARDGSNVAAGMAASSYTERGHCLVDVGRLDEAAAAYEEGIRRDEKLEDQRGSAIGKMQLGTVRMLQGRYADALSAYVEARQTFEELKEPRSVATIWHQIGMVLTRARHYEQAERAYRQSLAICVQQRNAEGEAKSLTEMGTLYHAMGRLEEAVRCLRQAVDIRVRLKNHSSEGTARNNLAYMLLELRRYAEARKEVLHAIECMEPYGHAAEPWLAWGNLHHLELATGDAEAATRARQRAVESYLAYRRDGGYGTTPSAELCAATADAIQAKDISELEQYLAQPLGDDAPLWVKALFPKVLAVLRGEGTPALAADPNLDYKDTVELILLLGTLQKG